MMSNNTNNSNQLSKSTKQIHGFIHPSFTAVGELMRRQLPGNGVGGAALSMYLHGECIADLWGGTMGRSGKPWQKDTMAISFSTTKGIASTLLHILAEQGKIDYDRPVADYWPEFAQNGKESITVRTLLCHEAGMYDMRGILDDASQMMEWDTVVQRLAAATPRHQPGTSNGYHGLTFGYLVGELIARVTGMSFPEALQHYLAEPFDLDGLYCGLPSSQDGRRAELILKPRKPSADLGNGTKTTKKIMIPLVNAFLGATDANLTHTKEGLLPKGMSQFDFNHPDVLRSCIPSANGVFTARSLAKVYGMIANKGVMDGKRYLSEERIAEMGMVQNTRVDRVVPMAMKWRLGYHRLFSVMGKAPNGFGHFGYGGSGAWCDPSRGLSFALTVNTGIGTPFGDTRVASLTTLALRAADRHQRLFGNQFALSN